MSKLLLIGIDALDAVQMEQLVHRMPHFAQLREVGYYTQLESVWPPDSETAWATIYTGWNPARHGIFRFVDPLQKTSTYIARERNNSVLRGHTFWDLGGAAGRRVCVLFPHIGYPSWPVNGLMVTRGALNGDLSVTPPELKRRYTLDGLRGMEALVGRDRGAFLAAFRRLVERQLEFTLDIVCKEQWDLVFSYWPALDVIQHQFWNFYDPRDPTFPGDTPFREAIPIFYALHDHVVGTLASMVDAQTTVLVMSDHGHGMRPVKIFNINRLLCDHGLLQLKPGSGQRRMAMLKQIKNSSMAFISRFELGPFAARVLKAAPWTKNLYLATSSLDLERSVAYITDMSGIKAYSYGGIRIRHQNLNGRPYETVREEIINLLLETRTLECACEPLVRWIKRREEIYAGPLIGDFPDIVFELHPAYGAGWDPEGPLFDVSLSHNLFSGSHIRSNAVFLMVGPDAKRVDHAPSSMMDVAPTVLDMLDVALPPGLEGSTILRPRGAPQ